MARISTSLKEKIGGDLWEVLKKIRRENKRGFITTPEAKEILSQLARIDLDPPDFEALLGYKWGSIKNALSYHKIKIEKPIKTAEVSAPDIDSPEFREQFFGFMRNKTIQEMREKFNLSEEQVNCLLKNPPKEHGIYKDSSRPTATYFCIFKGRVEIQDRIWDYVLAKDGGAAVDIVFPTNIGWREKRTDDASKRKLEKMRIVPIADIWFGDRLHDANLFRERIAWIAREPHVFWFFNGDAIKPPATRKEIDDFEKLCSEFREKLAPISHKWLWAQEGCFEAKLHNAKDTIDPIDDLCEEWDIPYFRTPMSVGIHWAGNLFKFYCIHGKTQAQKKGSKINAIARVLGEVEFNHFYVMSHIKDAIFRKQLRISQDPERFDLLERKQYLFITPSFVKYDGSRDAKWGYPLPARSQVNCVLYIDGDYHFYSSPVATGLVGVEEEKQ